MAENLRKCGFKEEDIKQTIKIRNNLVAGLMSQHHTGESNDMIKPEPKAEEFVKNWRGGEKGRK
jgi:hypothetical protein